MQYLNGWIRLDTQKKEKIRIMKSKGLFVITILMSMFLSFTAFAGVWRAGTGENQTRWWYDNGDGTYAQNGWQWIDGDQDGTAECYYFDGDGWMTANGTTPDGYQLNEAGAWVSDGIVQTKTASTAANQTDRNTLVIYFSRTGTTQRAAEQIQKLTGGRLLKLEAADPYNGSYEATLSRAERELNSGSRPAVTTVVDNMEAYDTIFVGYPIWYGDAPMVIYTFLESYDLSGKTIVPFCTSGSSGIETSMRAIRNACPNSRVLQGSRVNAVSTIQPWIAQLGL